MYNQMNTIEKYYHAVFEKMVRLLPSTGGMAALFFTIARLTGLFPEVTIGEVVAFDICCLAYFVICFIFNRRYGFNKVSVDEKTMHFFEYLLVFIVIFQWNLISYLFPARDFWGFACFFLLLTAFLFETKVVLFTSIGLTLSVAISWVIKADELLPRYHDMFSENLYLRIIGMSLAFFMTYLLCYFGRKFMEIAKENEDSLASKNHELEKSNKDIIDFTSNLIEERDITSGTHVKRVRFYTEKLAQVVMTEYPDLGLTEEKIAAIVFASCLHDVGKICIPDSILQKPARLTEEEFEIIKTHTVKGAEIIDRLPDTISSDFRKNARDICLYHHERTDGKGYPEGLCGDQIPLSAQIVAVVDCYDALTTERPYKKAFSGEEAYEMILNQKCGVFSKRMMHCFILCKPDFLSANINILGEEKR